jgi:stage II sporulation protein D
VLTYGGDVCVALYHANCGGVTSNGSEPYLRSVPDTPGKRRNAKAYCSGDPNFRWKLSVGRESLNSVVSRIGCVKAKVRSARLETDKESGRVKYLHFVTDKGNVRVQGSDFRAGMGLKSQNFTMAIRGSTTVFDGRGWGHGSGLCQDGAIGMAQSGVGYKDILHHYYSGVSLTKKY